MSSAAPEARIRMFMDAVVAEYQATVARWNLLQNAGLGIAVLAVFGYLNAELDSGRATVIVVVGAACIVVSFLGLEWAKRSFEHRVIRLANQLERMMSRRGP